MVFFALYLPTKQNQKPEQHAMPHLKISLIYVSKATNALHITATRCSLTTHFNV